MPHIKSLSLLRKGLPRKFLAFSSHMPNKYLQFKVHHFKDVNRNTYVNLPWFRIPKIAKIFKKRKQKSCLDEIKQWLWYWSFVHVVLLSSSLLACLLGWTPREEVWKMVWWKRVLYYTIYAEQLVLDNLENASPRSGILKFCLLLFCHYLHMNKLEQKHISRPLANVWPIGA